MRILTALLLLTLFIPAPAAAVFGDGNEFEKNPVIKDIVIEGDATTNHDLVRWEMGLEVGQRLSREDMNAIWIHLEDIGWFSYVDMEFDTSAGDGVILRVYLEEELTMAYGPLVRYDRRHKYLLGGWLEELNLRGRGEVLRVELSGLYLQRGSARLTHPWLFGKKGLSYELGLEAEQSNFVYRPTRQRLWRAELGLRWDLVHGLFTEAGVAYGVTDFRDSYSWDDRGTGTATLHETGGVDRTAFRFSMGVDTRDNPWYPAHGIMARLDWTRWDGVGFPGYDQGDADVRIFAPLPLGNHVLALRAWGRSLSGPAPLDNFLYLGGPETVRGHTYAGWEGDEGYLLSVEYRIPLAMMPISPRGESVGVGLHAFADAGDAWFHENDAGRALHSYGAGLHLNLDTMQLRFEAAKPEDGDWTFEFMDRFNF